MISVIIPAYNCEQYIVEAVDSVLNQTVKDTEIIIVDDGSTDNTRDITARYGAKIRYVRRENKGVSAARNTGIGLARGRLIAFLDADDIWLPGKLERQLRAFEENPSAGLVTCGLTVIDEKGTAVREIKEEPAADKQNILEKMVIRGIVGTSPSCVMVKRECFDKSGIFDETLCGAEDRDLWMRIARHYQVIILPECLIKYRVHDNNAHKDVARMKASHQQFLEKNLAGLNWLTRRKAYSYLYLDAAREFEAKGSQAKCLYYAFLSLLHCPLKSYPGDDKYQLIVKSIIRIFQLQWGIQTGRENNV
jgi:glycosyltransferase involved in cell wall biosynthesis